jgi:hypothetical protein
VSAISRSSNSGKLHGLVDRGRRHDGAIEANDVAIGGSIRRAHCRQRRGRDSHRNAHSQHGFLHAAFDGRRPRVGSGNKDRSGAIAAVAFTET